MRVYTWERKANQYPDEQSELGNNHNIASAMIWQQYVNLRWFFNNVFQFEFVNRKIWSNRNWQYDYIPAWRKGRRNPPGTGVFSVAWNRNFNEKVDKKGIGGQRIDIFFAPDPYNFHATAYCSEYFHIMKLPHISM